MLIFIVRSTISCAGSFVMDTTLFHHFYQCLQLHFTHHLCQCLFYEEKAHQTSYRCRHFAHKMKSPVF
ncbi:hypothetical protein B4168_3903 [Anoxybacillus flavithermus]|nr:hypothetical protein B4168_3903 [Anoxybacillus flavithermus]OAO87911.1 hypothetical protein GT23_0644 [Parageobacillus thermoglucosidasius]